MQKVTTKTRTRYLAAILAAILMCLMAVIGFSANTPKTHASTVDDEPIKVGISFPIGFKYYDYLGNYLTDLLEAQEYEVKTYRCPDGLGQSSDIDRLVYDEHIDVLIVAPFLMPVNSLTVISRALYDAKQKQVEIIVLGEFNPNFPQGITYMTLDYQGLGISYADSIFSDRPDIDENAVINIYYHADANGIDFAYGVVDGLQQYGVSDDNIKIIEIYDPSQVINSVCCMMNEYPMGIDEIVTYDFDTAELILQYYYSQGYYDSTIGIGTGIRALANDYEDDYEGALNVGFEDLGEKIIGVLDAIFLGNLFPDSVMIGGSRIIYYISFLPGHVQYVE